MMVESEESVNQSESGGCLGVFVGMGNARVCLQGCLGDRRSLGQG